MQNPAHAAGFFKLETSGKGAWRLSAEIRIINCQKFAAPRRGAATA
jgi:hypothetical protein